MSDRISISRRGLFTLTGGAALGVGVAGRPAAAQARSFSTDYPPATWVEADAANFTAADRPHDLAIQYIVIHTTQETYRDALDIFRDPTSAVSAHYVVSSAEGYVAQCVRDADIAWHAGNWTYNQHAIGVEHEGWVDDPSWYTTAMYQASAKLVAYKCDQYGIPKDRSHIIGHYEVPNATHTDPGPYWDWDTYMSLVTSA